MRSIDQGALFTIANVTTPSRPNETGKAAKVPGRGRLPEPDEGFGKIAALFREKWYAAERIPFLPSF
jgi:hypothetical protein